MRGNVKVKGVLEFAQLWIWVEFCNEPIRRDLKLCFDLGGYVGRYSNMDPLFWGRMYAK